MTPSNWQHWLLQKSWSAGRLCPVDAEEHQFVARRCRFQLFRFQQSNVDVRLHNLNIEKKNKPVDG